MCLKLPARQEETSGEPAESQRTNDVYLKVNRKELHHADRFHIGSFLEEKREGSEKGSEKRPETGPWAQE